MCLQAPQKNLQPTKSRDNQEGNELACEDPNDKPHIEVPDISHLMSSMNLILRNTSNKTSHFSPEHDVQTKVLTRVFA